GWPKARVGWWAVRPGGSVRESRGMSPGAARARPISMAPRDAASMLLLLALSLSTGPPARAAPASGDVYAVVIGYNGGQRRLPGLRSADDDAVRFALLLGGLDTPERRVRVWTLTEIDAETEQALARAGLHARRDGPPTRAAVDAALAEVGRALAARR